MEALSQSFASRRSRVVAALVSGGLLVIITLAVVLLVTVATDNSLATRHTADHPYKSPAAAAPLVPAAGRSTES